MSDKRRNVEIPRYARKVIRAIRERQPIPGEIQVVRILHDDWCDLLANRGPCNCDPEIRMPEMPGRN